MSVSHEDSADHFNASWDAQALELLGVLACQLILVGTQASRASAELAKGVVAAESLVGHGFVFVVNVHSASSTRHVQ